MCYSAWNPSNPDAIGVGLKCSDYGDVLIQGLALLGVWLSLIKFHNYIHCFKFVSRFNYQIVNFVQKKHLTNSTAPIYGLDVTHKAMIAFD